MYQSDLKHPNQGLQDKLHMLYALNRDSKIDLSFRPPFLDLLHELGDPHLNLPPVIHVAGTNGKGSTIALMRSILESAGYRVHVYTSPHLIRFNERIILAGQMISDEALEPLLDRTIKANKQRSVTFFEITTALAFTAFSEATADILLLEVGLGGRLDCTNVIERSAVSVISKIGLDHQEFLGETPYEIAGEKAGIIKHRGLCVASAQSDEAIKAIEEKAAECDSELHLEGASWVIEKIEDRIRFRYANDSYMLPLPSLLGTHQIHNAGLALASLKTLEAHHDFVISEQAMATGLQNAIWAARLQKLNVRPKDGWEMWLDGGHNEDAAKIIAEQARTWADEDSKPLHLVLGMMRHKDHAAFLTPLLEHVQSIHVIDIPTEDDCLKAGEVSRLTDKPCAHTDSLDEAIKAITIGPEGRILVAGSLYLAGHVLQSLENGA